MSARLFAATSLLAVAVLAATPAAAGGAFTEIVSLGTSGRPANDDSIVSDISRDGREVAFISFATDLVPGDTNGGFDVFVHDRKTRVTERVSVSSAGAQIDTGASGVAISDDGRYVAFGSRGSNLVPSPWNDPGQIFVRDRKAGTTTAVSVDDAGALGNGASFSPAISGNGRFVAFTSYASNLPPGDVDDSADVFVHDLRARTTRQVSVSSAGQTGNGASDHASLDAHGRFVAFSSQASNLVPGDTNGSEDIFVHDRRTGSTRRVSVSSAGVQADDRSQLPALSADGRVVVFDSHASNLVPGHIPQTWDVVLRDLRSGASERVNVTSAGAFADLSGEGLPDAHGRVVAFGSAAPNLSPFDTNGANQIVVRDRRGR